MQNRSSRATLCNYKLFVEQKGPIDPSTGESWRARVLAPSGQPVIVARLEEPYHQAAAQAIAEQVAREHAEKSKALSSEVLPEWTED